MTRAEDRAQKKTLARALKKAADAERTPEQVADESERNLINMQLIGLRDRAATGDAAAIAQVNELRARRREIDIASGAIEPAQAAPVVASPDDPRERPTISRPDGTTFQLPTPEESQALIAQLMLGTEGVAYLQHKQAMRSRMGVTRSRVISPMGAALPDTK